MAEILIMWTCVVCAAIIRSPAVFVLALAFAIPMTANYVLGG